MYSGLEAPLNFKDSSKRKDWRMASDENPKMDMKVFEMKREMSPTRTHGAIGD